MVSPSPQNFFSGKPITAKLIRNAIDKMREAQVRPDLSGNLNFRIDPAMGCYHPFDERDSWLSGKPVGGAS